MATVANPSSSPSPTLPSNGHHKASENDHARLANALADAQSGDQHAYTILFRDLQPRLLKQLRALVGDHDAQDIAAEAWIHIIAGVETFHGTYANFRGWAVTIARRRATDHLRRNPPPTPVDPTDLPEQLAPDDTEHEVMQTLATAAVLQLIKALPMDQQRIVMLRVIVGLDARRTADLLGKRPGSIRTGAHRALKTLAAQLS